ncbi:ABC transporter ATP-binding protein [Nonomuraea ferruginea]|uniref:ABC transporter ATP-binding protein n=1 Tax=Nonomuraea ferruginea TaxID=46174 RepID=A0ABT4T2F0_9ACTN|nr:ABC transporter ATP-binding protein [Nonomuraea ferruginea]MDA0643686.1 ABC transporter ATP-binding protein [Nonomuraea ferruginea]
MIDVTDLVVSYGTAIALDHVTLAVGKGEMVALLGPNGAGKSTLANTLAGLLAPASGTVSGTVRVEGRLALVPEGRQLFPDMSVADNLALGGWRSGQRDPAPVYELLPRLAELAGRRAGVLSGGEQQMVAVGRALMSRPQVLVVDELSLGLAPNITADLAAHLATLNREQGLAVLLIEQNARLAFELCSRAYVLESGQVRAEGACAELADDPRVASAYLGGAIT